MEQALGIQKEERELSEIGTGGVGKSHLPHGRTERLIWYWSQSLAGAEGTKEERGQVKCEVEHMANSSSGTSAPFNQAQVSSQEAQPESIFWSIWLSGTPLAWSCPHSQV